MSIKRVSNKSSIQGVTRDVKRERTFELSLPALVKGIDALKNEFQERAQLSSISSQEAALRLNSKVMIGSRLNLALNIPKTLILEKSLKLHLSGTVIIVQPDTNGRKKQLISLRLDNNYRIQPLLFKKY